jgi:hypothetical protein
LYEIPVGNVYVSPAKSSEQELHSMIRARTKVVERKNVEMHQLLGEGSFGEVFSGTWSVEPGGATQYVIMSLECYVMM